MKKSIDKLRNEINEVNEQLIDSLNKRATLVREISVLKDEKQEDYFDPVREQEMLMDVLSKNKGPLPDELLKDVFQKILSSSLYFMEIKKDKLLVSEENNFQDIKTMFDLSDDRPIIIAGPCAVEGYEYLDKVGQLLKSKNIKFLRGGTYKPRTSPYDFQGLKKEGLEILRDIGHKYDLITITEVVDTRDVQMVSEHVDILQIGARNMHNFELLKEVGQSGHPVLLKRGLSATIQELIFAAEYIAVQGNRKIILCERGIRTFETKTRNTLDIASIPILKKETKLPVVVDISHSLGRKDIANAVAKSVVAVGADGIMVELHPQPELALSDSKQQLNPREFEELLKCLGI